MQITFAHGLIRATFCTPYNKTAAQFRSMKNKKNKKTKTQRKSMFFKKVNATSFTQYMTRTDRFTNGGVWGGMRRDKGDRMHYKGVRSPMCIVTIR